MPAASTNKRKRRPSERSGPIAQRAAQVINGVSKVLRRQVARGRGLRPRASSRKSGGRSERAESRPLKAVRRSSTSSDPADNDNGDDDDDTACSICGSADHAETLLLCDGCDCGFHCGCLVPALVCVPEGDFFCPQCALKASCASAVARAEAPIDEIDQPDVLNPQAVAVLVGDMCVSPCRPTSPSYTPPSTTAQEIER